MDRGHLSSGHIGRVLAALWRDRRGTSLIEMGFILPVMVLLAAMAIDLGLVFLRQMRIQQAAARTMEMAIAYRSSTTALSTSLIDQEGATAYGLASNDPANQVTANLWLECAGVRQTTYTATCTTGTPARYASVAITDTYRWTFASVVHPGSTTASIPLRGFAMVRLQ